jgi:hypothetical protein
MSGRVTSLVVAAWILVSGAAIGDLFDHPPMTTLALSVPKPPDLQEKVVYRGAQRQYARLCYPIILFLTWRL